MNARTERLIGVFLLVVGIGLVVPLVALSAYNHPSPADDYCFANTAIRYGFWKAQQLYYDGWTGRFFHNFIVHASPLTIGWYGGFKIYPVVLLCLLAGSCFLLLRQWLYVLPTNSYIIWGAAIVFIGFVATLPSLAEYLYWFTGGGSYGLSSVLFIGLLSVWIAHQRRGFGLIPLFVLIEVALVVAIIGSSEMTMVLLLSVLALGVLAEWLQRRRISGVWVVLGLAAMVACYYLFSAPGNAIRMGGNPNSSNIGLTLVSSLKYAALYVPRQLFLSCWIPLTLLYLPLGWRLVKAYAGQLPPFLRVPLWLGSLHGAATVLVLISLHFYGVGIPPIPRLINLVNLAFWLTWLYNITLLLVAVRSRIRSFSWEPLVWIGIAGSVIGVLAGPVLLPAYTDWLSGCARAYDQAMMARYAQLAANPNQTTALSPLPCYPKSVFLEDITPNPQHLWNRCWADYYRQKAVILTHKPSR